MDKQDTQEYALHQLICLLDAHPEHYKSLGIYDWVKGAHRYGSAQIGKVKTEEDYRFNEDRTHEEREHTASACENDEHRIGTFKAGVATG